MKKFAIEAWEKHKDELREKFRKDPDIWREEYKDIVTTIYQTLFPDQLKLDRITQVDDGDYQGSLLFLVPSYAYQPTQYEYLTTWVDYGSCSGCDALQAIQEEFPWPGTGGEVSETALDDLMALAFDIVRHTELFRPHPYQDEWNEEMGF